MSYGLQLTLLGDCRIELNGDPLASLTLAKARALLCYLAMSERAQPRGLITGLLWGELNEADARRNLRVVLTKLRGAVGDYVLVTRSALAFNRDLPHTIDAALFAQGATQLLASTNDAPALRQLFGRYTGDFLRGLEVRSAPAFEEWLQLQREQLRQLARKTGQWLATHYEQAGYDADAMAVCVHLVELEPWQEDVQRCMMRLLARGGQPAAALRQFDQYRRTLGLELGIEPEGATLALAERIRTQTLTHDAQAAPESPDLRPPHNLPAPTTTFVGRATELAQIDWLLVHSDCRLLTLIGLGGVGKTRLALQVAHTLIARQSADTPSPNSPFRQGIYFVSLAAFNTPEQIIAAIASAMNVTFSGKLSPWAQLLNHVRDRELLLVLDNFEHVVGEAALLTELLQAAPGLKVLVTSRERLNLYEEWLFDVHGLPIPDSAIQLFSQRARRLNVQFDLAHTTQAVSDICRLMDGLPLGIELAAGWVRTLSCDEIASGIRRNLDILRTSARNVPERHRSLSVAFDYSWDMLPRDDARKLARLAVFHDNFDSAAAQAIAGASRADLARLADKSLLEWAGDERWGIHQMLRQYLLDRLAEPDRRPTQLAHCQFYSQLVTQYEPMRETLMEAQVLEAIRREIGNVRAAWEWALEHIRQGGYSLGDMVTLVNRFVPMLAHFFVRECRYQEGWVVLAAAQQAMRTAGWAAVDAPATTLAITESFLAEMDFSLSRYGDAVALLEGALPVLRGSGQHGIVAEALTRLGKALVRLGHYELASPALKDSLALFQSAGDTKGSTAALNWLAAWHSNQGQFEEARIDFEACLRIYRANGYRRGIANTLSNLASNYGRSGQFAEERPLIEEAYQLALEVGEPMLIATTLSNLADSVRTSGDLKQARHCFERSLALCRALSERRWIAANLVGLGLTLLDSGERERARDALLEALAIAHDIQSTPDVLDALGGLGELLANTGRYESAATVLHCVASHPVTQRMARERSQCVITAYSEQLPVVPAARLSLDVALTLARDDLT
jgi:predicted ATPase/DNA-binding SARP family transcriptional activator